MERQIGNIVDAIAQGLRSPGLQAKLDALEAQRTKLKAAAGEPSLAPPALHPNLAEVYRDRVAKLETVLAAQTAPEVLEATRALIDRVIIHPPKDPGGPPGIELVGQLLAMLQAGGANFPSGIPSVSASVLRLLESSVKAGSGGRSPPQRRPPAPSLTPAGVFPCGIPVPASRGSGRRRGSGS